MGYGEGVWGEGPGIPRRWVLFIKRLGNGWWGVDNSYIFALKG